MKHTEFLAKAFFLILSVALLFTLIFAFASCKNGETENVESVKGMSLPIKTSIRR